MKEDTSGRGDFELLPEEMFTKDYLLVIMNWEKESQKEGEQTEKIPTLIWIFCMCYDKYNKSNWSKYIFLKGSSQITVTMIDV